MVHEETEQGSLSSYRSHVVCVSSPIVSLVKTLYTTCEMIAAYMYMSISFHGDSCVCP